TAIRLEPTLTYDMPTNLPTEEWITNVYLDEKNHKLYAMIDTKILVYDHLLGHQIDTLLHISTRQITCMLHHEFYHYTIIGCADGAIKVKNMTNAEVHSFHSHTKPVTGLTLYPYGPLIVSCALDYTVRIWSLKSFREVYSLHLQSQPRGMQVMDDHHMYIYTRDTVHVWGFNHLNSVFSSVNSRVKSLTHIQSPFHPLPRILSRTEDGIMRLVSPVTGKPITTALPLAESEAVLGVAWCAKIDRMYLMLHSGDIWVVATNYNPCVIVDIWHMGGEGSREDVTHISIFDGQFHSSDPVPSSYPKHLATTKGYAFLLAGTRNGQILLYGRKGHVGDRYLLHAGEVTHLSCDVDLGVVVSAGSDNIIKISTVTPIAEEILQAKISIGTHYVPRLIAVVEATLCSASDDWTTHMYSFDLGRKEWRRVPSHNRTDDHTDTVTAICSLKKLGMFVTISKDGAMKVWDCHNNLIREILFQEPLESICPANPQGDLLIGIQNRIDIIKSGLCKLIQQHDISHLRPLGTIVINKTISDLPPGYTHLVPPTEKVIEQPIPFDDNRVQWEIIQTHAPKRPTQPQSRTQKPDPLELFHEINLVGVDHDWGVPAVVETKKEVVVEEKRKTEEEVREDAVFEALERKLDVLVGAEESEEKGQGEAEKVVKEEDEPARVDPEELDKYLRFRPFRGTSREVLNGIPVDFWPTSPGVMSPKFVPTEAPAEVALLVDEKPAVLELPPAIT
ncbi:hypothetical protein HK097_004267, partial [Rhizophlyctis rosea]